MADQKRNDIDARRLLSQAISANERADALVRWSDDAINDPSACRMALALLSSVGQFDLYDCEPENESLLDPLPPTMIDGGILAGYSYTDELTRRVEALPSDLELAEEGFEADSLRISLLEDRWDLQACRVAASRMIDELIQSHEIKQKTYDRIAVSIDRLRSQLEELDKKIADVRDELAAVTQTSWIENRIADLRPDAWIDRPWWLTDEIFAIHAFHARILDRCRWAEESEGIADPSQLRAEWKSPTARSSSESYSIAANDKPSQPSESRLAFSVSVEDANFEVDFYLPEQYRLASPQAVPDHSVVSIEVTVTIEANAEGERDSEGLLHRKYRIRWGDIIERVEVSGDSSMIDNKRKLYGRLEIPYRRLKLLDCAINPRIHVRRVE